MLTTFFLQPADLANFDTEFNGLNPLPQEAIEPLATFADLLELDTELALPLEIGSGQHWPEDGNDLPLRLVDVESALLPGEAFEPPPEQAVNSLPTTPAVATSTPAVVTTSPESDRPATPAIALSQAVHPMSISSLAAVERPIAQQAQLRPLPDAVADRSITALLGNAVTEETADLRPSAPRPIVERPQGQILRRAAATLVAVDADADTDLDVDRLLEPPATAGRPAPAQRAAQRVTSVLGNSAAATKDIVDQADWSPDVKPALPASSALRTAQPQVSAPIPIEIAVTQPASIGSLSTVAPATLTAVEPSAATLPTPQPIHTPVADAAWGERIGERVLVMANNRLQSAEIRLTPAELGPLRVQVVVDDGAANVTFYAQHVLTREAIEQAIPRLREMLAENGLTLDQTHIGEQGVQQGNRDRSENQAAPSYPNEAVTDQASVEDARLAERRPQSRVGLVDTFV